MRQHKKLCFSRHCEWIQEVLNFNQIQTNKSTAPQEAVEKEGHYGNDSGDYQTGEVDETLKTLADAGYPAVTKIEVYGRGKQKLTGRFRVL